MDILEFLDITEFQVNIYILGYPDKIEMPTLLIKNVPEELMRKLRRLKVELNCRTWAELLEKLVNFRSIVVERVSEDVIEEFLELRDVVTKRWGKGEVLEEFRRARGHEEKATNFGR